MVKACECTHEIEYDFEYFHINAYQIVYTKDIILSNPVNKVTYLSNVS